MEVAGYLILHSSKNSFSFSASYVGIKTNQELKNAKVNADFCM
jgi:hypothetical protein